MEGSDHIVFKELYLEAYSLCFKKSLQQPISETESKLFSNQILEQTGLTIGWRSLKNYSFYLFADNNDRQENPSTATLDTLARYVLKAPYTNELSRKNDEGHHPYWYLYQTRLLEQTKANQPTKRNPLGLMAGIILIVLIAGVILYVWHSKQQFSSFTDSFEQLNQKDLQSRGWRLQDEDQIYWNKRNSRTGSLTLFTLPGDNWPDNTAPASIKNLLFRSLPQDCFRLELQMEDFIPAAEWQQAGILLLADSSLNSASIRLSLAYNDFFGGNDQPKEVIVQAISSPGDGAKPEEFIHYKTLSPDSAKRKPVLFGNLKHTALRIEKQGNRYRFLYSGGFTENDAFKELATKDIPVIPHYVAIFALKGRVKNTPVASVTIKKFILQPITCK